MISPPLRTNQQEQNYSLQILRGIAAFVVVIYHIKGYTNIVGNNPNTIYNYIPEIFGFGAPLFFCISGFVMALLVQRNSKNFLYKRFLRIYPPFIIATILVIFVKTLLFGSVSFNNLFQALTLLPLGNTPSYPLNIEWTLTYEIFFYIVCSLFTIKYLRKFFLPFLFLWGIVISIAHYAFNVPTEPITTFKLIPFSTFNYFFIMGAMVYYLPPLKKFVSNKMVYVLLSVTTFIIFFVYYNILGNFLLAEKLYHLIFAILFGILVYVFVNLKSKSSTVYVRSGDYSYGIYLIHAQTMFIALTVWKDIFHFPINELASTFALIITIIVSWYFGKFEYSLHTKLKKIKIPTINLKRFVAAATVCMLLLSFVSIQRVYSTKSKEVTATTFVATFDPAEVLDDKVSAGWVDSVSDTSVGNNQTITLSGWAIDPFLSTPATGIILVTGGNIIPSEINWYERTGLAEIYKTDSVLMSGYVLTVNYKHLNVGENSLDIYAVTNDHKYIPLQVASPIVITKK